MVVRDGHQGPREIGLSDEFFEWLTDPVENGGGALIDFGCYGADDLSSLETNMIVVETLEAAGRSANTGKTIYLKH